MMMTAMLIGFVLLNLGVKPMVARLRPFELQPAVQLLIHEPWDYSFPSGHAWSALAAVIILFMNKIPGRYVALGVALLISFFKNLFICALSIRCHCGRYIWSGYRYGQCIRLAFS